MAKKRRMCRACEKEKPYSSFPPGTNQLRCKTCKRRGWFSPRYLESEADQVRERLSHWPMREWRWPLTAHERRTLRQRFKKCLICGYGERLHVDHNHGTREIRGILCTGCNLGLGAFQDNPDRLRRAAQYLEDPPALQTRAVIHEDGTHKLGVVAPNLQDAARRIEPDKPDVLGPRGVFAPAELE